MTPSEPLEQKGAPPRLGLYVESNGYITGPTWDMCSTVFVDFGIEIEAAALGLTRNARMKIEPKIGRILNLELLRFNNSSAQIALPVIKRYHGLPFSLDGTAPRAGLMRALLHGRLNLTRASLIPFCSGGRGTLGQYGCHRVSDRTSSTEDRHLSPCRPARANRSLRLFRRG